MKPEKLPALSEKDFLAQIIEFARKYKGWKVAHFRPALVKKGNELVYRTPVQANGAGFPDLIMTREERCIVAEVKSEKGRCAIEQAGWLSAFAMTKGVETYIWKPSMWLEIEKVLE